MQKALQEAPEALNLPDRIGKTPLHIASQHGYLDIALLLVSMGCEIVPRYMLGQTPIHVASRWGSDRVVELLLDKGCDPQHKI